MPVVGDRIRQFIYFTLEPNCEKNENLASRSE